MSFLSSLRRRDGYTAIVVAALFTLFAAIIVLFLPSDEVAELSKQEKTRERMDTIDRAIQKFYADNGRYPCPARRDLKPNDVGFGKSEDCGAAVPTGITATGTTWIGMAPVRTLGLSVSIAGDAWGSKIQYAINKDLATNDTSTYNGTLTIRRAAGATGLNLLSHPAGSGKYVLLSTGKDRVGGFPLESTSATPAVACAAASDVAGVANRLRENCDGDTIFVEEAYRASDQNIGSDVYFDDLLFGSWTNRSFKISEYGRTPGSGAGSGYGGAIALSDDALRMVVGEPGASSNMGRVLVYDQSAGAWGTPNEISVSGAAGDRFGTCIDLSADGRQLIVGAPGADSGKGIAYIYTYDGTNWNEASPFVINNTLAIAGEANDPPALGSFCSMSSDGRSATASAPGMDESTAAAGRDNGFTFVARNPSGTWSVESSLLTSGNPAADGSMGPTAVSDDNETSGASGQNGLPDIAVVGAPGENSGAGNAYYYRDGAWATAFALPLPPSSPAANTRQFGVSVDVSADGDVLAVGAREDFKNGADAGAVYIYKRLSSGYFSLAQRITGPDTVAGDRFGDAVALSDDGKALVVGAVGDLNEQGTQTGSAYKYELQDGVFIMQQRIYPSDNTASISFGSAIGISATGTNMVVGAPGATGAIYTLARAASAPGAAPPPPAPGPTPPGPAPSPSPCTSPCGSIAHGATCTAYQSSSVACGSTCTSETRTCTNGSLSGSYTNASCSVAACASCTLPWGGTIAHGANTSAYSVSSVACPSTCPPPTTRTCNNGTLSGSGDHASCTVTGSCGASCTLPWGGSIAHGANVTAYSTSSVACGSSCPAGTTRTCTNGTLSGSGDHASCSVAACASCTLPWGGTIAHGANVTAYSSSSVPCGSSCPAGTTRTCNDGTLSGSGNNASCSVAACSSCTLPWGGSIAHGASVTAYSSSSVPCGSTCPVGTTRSCSNGTLSGSGNFASCSEDPCDGDPCSCAMATGGCIVESGMGCWTECCEAAYQGGVCRGMLCRNSGFGSGSCFASFCP